MKKILFLLSISVTLLTSLSSCNQCKKCHANVVAGLETPKQEMCGDQLKQAEKTPGMVCE